MRLNHVTLKLQYQNNLNKVLFLKHKQVESNNLKQEKLKMNKIAKELMKIAEELIESETNNETFECPECGTDVLDNTGYCVDCEQKVKDASKKTAAETFPCPECGTKVLENTHYCMKCKKKVGE